MGLERRGWVMAAALGQPVPGKSPWFKRRQPSRDGTSRMVREYQVRICERLEVKFPGAYSAWTDSCAASDVHWLPDTRVGVADDRARRLQLFSDGCEPSLRRDPRLGQRRAIEPNFEPQVVGCRLLSQLCLAKRGSRASSTGLPRAGTRLSLGGAGSWCLRARFLRRDYSAQPHADCARA